MWFYQGKVESSLGGLCLLNYYVEGLDYDRETMKLLLDKQEKQMLFLDKEARQYATKVRQKDRHVADTRERQRMMGEYNPRVNQITQVNANIFLFSKNSWQRRSSCQKGRRYKSEETRGTATSAWTSVETAKKCQNQKIFQRISNGSKKKFNEEKISRLALWKVSLGKIILPTFTKNFDWQYISEEQMLKRIFEEGLTTQKNRLRELRSYAQG